MQLSGRLDQYIQSLQALFKVLFRQVKSTIIVIDHSQQKWWARIIGVQLCNPLQMAMSVLHCTAVVIEDRQPLMGWNIVLIYFQGLL